MAGRGQPRRLVDSPRRLRYGADGATFTPIGNGFTMDNAWQLFMGHRYAMFDCATQTLGGAVTVKSFDRSTPRARRVALPRLTASGGVATPRPGGRDPFVGSGLQSGTDSTNPASGLRCGDRNRRRSLGIA